MYKRRGKVIKYNNSSTEKSVIQDNCFTATMWAITDLFMMLIILEEITISSSLRKQQGGHCDSLFSKSKVAHIVPISLTITG
jgi:hypothetical protein